MSNKNEQAFPHTFVETVPSASGGYERRTVMQAGMSLRDYFAAKALPQVIATYMTANGQQIGSDHGLRNCAALAYKYADAMLAERER